MAGDSAARPRRWRAVGQSLLGVPSRIGTISMATGIIALTLHNLPYHFASQGVLSVIWYMVDLVIFFTCLGFYLLKLCLRPKQTWKLWLTDPDELFCLPSFGISLSAITALLAYIATGAESFSPRWSELAFVLFWISTAENLVLIAILCTFLPNFGPLRGLKRFGAGFDATFLLAAVSPLTTAVAGAAIAQNALHTSARQNVPIIVVSYWLVGLGLWLATIGTVLVFFRIVALSAPPKEKVLGTFLLLGPIGQAATALFALAGSLEKNFAAYQGGAAAGQWLDPAAAPAVAAASNLGGILIYGMGVFVIFFVGIFASMQAFLRVRDVDVQIAETCSCGSTDGQQADAESLGPVLKEQGVKTGGRGLPSALSWWSVIFPMGTFTGASEQLASSKIGGQALKVWSAITLMIMVILWFVSMAYTLKGVFSSTQDTVQTEDENMYNRRHHE